MSELPPADAFVYDHDTDSTTHECRRCGVQWRLARNCWMCGEPGLPMNRHVVVWGMSVAFGPH